MWESKPCTNIQNEDNECIKYYIQCHALINIYCKRKKTFWHIIFDWNNVWNNEIGRFEESHKGLVELNVFEANNVFNDKGALGIESVRSKQSLTVQLVALYYAL